MPQEFDPALAIADVYAAALHSLASQQQLVDDLQAELDELADLLEHDEQIARFFSAESIKADERAKSLEQIFRGRIGDLVLNTLLVMNENGRVGLVPQLRRAFELRAEAARGQIEVTATSAVELDAPQRMAVAEVAARLAGKQPLVHYEVDAEIVGGLILEIGDQRYDNSLRRHLQLAHEKLTERSNRGLNIGLANVDTLTRPDDNEAQG